MKLKGTWRIYDENGKLEKEQEAKSYVQAIIYGLCSMWGNADQTIEDTGGIGRAIPNNQPQDGDGPVNNDNYGIQCGTGSTAVAIDDYQLDTKIAHGAGAGQLSHGATAVGAPGVVAGTASFTVTRTFTNNSGGAINVEEVGLVLKLGSFYWLVERSLLSFSIANGANKTVTYTISTTV